MVVTINGHMLTLRAALALYRVLHREHDLLRHMSDRIGGHGPFEEEAELLREALVAMVEREADRGTQPAR